MNLAEARVLEGSFRAHQPGTDFHTIVIDHECYVRSAIDDEGRGPAADGSVPLRRTRSLSALGSTGPANYAELFLWPEFGAIKAAVPRVAQALLNEYPHLDAIVMLSPWVEVHSSLEPLLAGLTLTDWSAAPKRLGPVQRSRTGKHDRTGLVARRRGDVRIEADLLLDGIHSWDTLVFGREATEVLEWLSDRIDVTPRNPALMDFALDDAGPLDRLLDVAVSLFGAVLIDHPGVGVAPWNLDERKLIHDDAGSVLARGRPLLTTNHAGHDPATPWLLRGRGDTRSTFLLSECSIAENLWSSHRRCVTVERRRLEHAAPFEGESLTPVIPFSASSRRLLRATAYDDEAELLRSPFATPAGTVSERLAWLRDAAAVHAMDTGTVEFEAISHLADQLPTSALIRRIPGRTGIFTERSAASGGVDVVGHLRSISGLGTAGRRIVESLRMADIRVSACDIPMSLNRSILEFPVENELQHDLLLAVMNGDVMAETRRAIGPRAFDRRYVIGQWAWESEELPVSHLRGFAYVDEIWAYSTYVADVIRRNAPEQLPVIVVPPALRAPVPDAAVTRASFGLDDRFMFLFVFDYFSTSLRKNPVGLIEAYRDAFGPEDGAQLVLKSMNGWRKPDAAEQVRAAARDREDIKLIDELIPAAASASLIAACDVYVSLHRSEGLGLTMAEAMLLEKPVVATAYGGNLDFMTEDSAILIEANPVSVLTGEQPYGERTVWAEPNRSAAARALRKLADDDGLRDSIAFAGVTLATDWFDPGRVAELMRQRLLEIGAMR